MLTGLPDETVERLAGYPRSEIIGLAMVLFRCRTIFYQLFLAFAIIYYDSHHRDILLRFSSPGKLPQMSVCYYRSASPECRCDLGFARKFF